MGGFNPKKVELMESTITDLSEFAEYLNASGQSNDSALMKQAITVIRSELAKMKEGSAGQMSEEAKAD